MAQKGNEEALLGALCASQEGFITYRALRTEVPLERVFTAPPSVPVYEIPPRASASVETELARARALFEERQVALFLPGRAFDRQGTRHGQGGGWYDRFLRGAPVSWLRIGVCFPHQVHETPLPRAPWDEPVDILVIAQKDCIEVVETGARLERFDTL